MQESMWWGGSGAVALLGTGMVPVSGGQRGLCGPTALCTHEVVMFSALFVLFFYLFIVWMHRRRKSYSWKWLSVPISRLKYKAWCWAAPAGSPDFDNWQEWFQLKIKLAVSYSSEQSSWCDLGTLCLECCCETAAWPEGRRQPPYLALWEQLQRGSLETSASLKLTEAIWESEENWREKRKKRALIFSGDGVGVVWVPPCSLQLCVILSSQSRDVGKGSRRQGAVYP